MPDEFAKVTPAQRQLLEILSSLKPYERVEITADKDGKPDTFLVHRSSKMVISGFTFISVK